MIKAISSILLMPFLLLAEDARFYFEDGKTPVTGTCEISKDRQYNNIKISIDGHLFIVEKMSHDHNCPFCTGEIY